MGTLCTRWMLNQKSLPAVSPLPSPGEKVKISSSVLNMKMRYLDSVQILKPPFVLFLCYKKWCFRSRICIVRLYTGPGSLNQCIIAVKMVKPGSVVLSQHLYIYIRKSTLILKRSLMQKISQYNSGSTSVRSYIDSVEQAMVQLCVNMYISDYNLSISEQHMCPSHCSFRMTRPLYITMAMLNGNIDDINVCCLYTKHSHICRRGIQVMVYLIGWFTGCQWSFCLDNRTEKSTSLFVWQFRIIIICIWLVDDFWVISHSVWDKNTVKRYSKLYWVTGYNQHSKVPWHNLSLCQLHIIHSSVGHAAGCTVIHGTSSTFSK